MNPYFKKALLAGAVLTLVVPTSAMAQKSAGGVVGGARLHPGTWGSSQRMSRSSDRYQPTYRSNAPVIVRSERAPEIVAQAPTRERSFSYEPSQVVQSGDWGCGEIVQTERARATAERAVERGRSFSYEPSMSDSSSGSYVAPRSYSSPRIRSYRSQTNWLSAPKDVRNNFRN
jgi:hypothetical protein